MILFRTQLDTGDALEYVFYFLGYSGQLRGCVNINVHKCLQQTHEPSTEQGVGRQARGCLGGGLAAARLSPILFLPEGSGLLLCRRIQCYLRPGTLALREGVVLGGNAVKAQVLA